MIASPSCYLLFFFNDTATTEIYTLSLHDALPILRNYKEEVTPLPGVDSEFIRETRKRMRCSRAVFARKLRINVRTQLDRKSTRLNSSHSQISYAVFCLKKKELAGIADAPDQPRPQ